MTRSIPAYAASWFLEFVAAHAAKGDEDATRLMGKVREKRPAKRINGQPTRKEARAAKLKARAEKAAKLRAEVLERDGGRCLVCGDPATEVHHLVYGTGSRRAAEGLTTLASLCAVHHKRAHAGGVGTLLTLILWARGWRYDYAAAAMERRLAKIQSFTTTGGRTP